MRAGAVGLTLTAADHCFILDTPQNAAVEEQAIDRIHRIVSCHFWLRHLVTSPIDL
jgi:SNF2 family DNA or RNA helicase